MRQLTSSQKKLLTKVLTENEPTPNEAMMFGNVNPVRDCDTLPGGVWEKLEAMNDTEILWQEVNRFISDWRFSKLNS